MATRESTGESKGERTRRRLLDAAAADAAEHGLDGASINRIAKIAGLRPGSVYFHFDSKQGLLDAMLETGLAESLGHLDHALTQLGADAGAATRLHAAVRAHLIALHELSDYARVLLATAGARPAGAYRSHLATYRDRWTAIIADAQADGVLADGFDPSLLRDLIFGALNQSLSNPAGWPPEQVARATIALIGASRGSGD